MSIYAKFIYGMKLGIEFADQEEKDMFDMKFGCVISLLIVDIAIGMDR
jgi:hypothetical protein